MADAAPTRAGPGGYGTLGALALPKNCHLRWARFVVNQRQTAEPNIDPVEFVSLLPAVVDEQIDMSGPIECDDAGNIHRGVVATGATGPQGSHYEPWTVGYLANAQTACWDFYPVRGSPPAGTQHLLLSVKSKHAAPAAVVQQCLYLHLESPGIGSMTFECDSDGSL